MCIIIITNTESLDKYRFGNALAAIRTKNKELAKIS